MARKPEDAAGRIISAALELSVSDGWRCISLADIADRAGVTLAEMHARFPSKTAILGGFFRRIDEEVLAGIDGGANGDSPRDRLFDVLMKRFDALTPHKAAVAAIMRDTLFDPFAGLCFAPRFLCSMAWMLEAAGLSSAGLAGLARVQGLAVIYADTFRVWLRDESADSSRTMAALDRRLNRAEDLIGWCRFVPRTGAAGDEPAGDAAAAG